MSREWASFTLSMLPPSLLSSCWSVPVAVYDPTNYNFVQSVKTEGGKRLITMRKEHMNNGSTRQQPLHGSLPCIYLHLEGSLTIETVKIIFLVPVHDAPRGSAVWSQVRSGETQSTHSFMNLHRNGRRPLVNSPRAIAHTTDPTPICVQRDERGLTHCTMRQT